MKAISYTILSALFFNVAGCLDLGYQPATFERINDKIVVNGIIDEFALDAFSEVTQRNPDVKLLVLQNVGGSADDDANLELSRRVHEAGFTTIVPAGGLVASGGTDLFLAGIKREIANGACLGVHSWGEEGLFSGRQGRDVPRDAPIHQIYLDYFNDIGIDPNFYWYTLEVADADTIHWMTKREIIRYGVVTHSLANYIPASPNECDQR